MGVTIEDDQKVDVEVTVSGGGAAPASSFAPTKTYKEASGQAGQSGTGGYLSALASNVLNSGGGSILSTHASYIPATAVGCSGGSTLSTHASNLGGAAPFQVGDYPAAPAASTPPPAAPVAVEVAAPVPIPSAGGDYLSAMGGGSA